MDAVLLWLLRSFYYIRLLARLELTTVLAFGQTNAIFVVLLAILFYGETVKIWRWMAVRFGFSSALLIMQPGQFFVWSSLLPIGAAFCYAASMVILHSFGKEVSNSILYLYSASAATVGVIVMALATTEFSPIASTPADTLLILSMSICGGFGVVFLMYAFRNAPASVLAPFSYFGILTSFGFIWPFFAEFPIDKLFPSVVRIIASGVTILWRERR